MNGPLISLAFAVAAFLGPLTVILQAPAPQTGGPILVISAQPEAVVRAAGADLIGPLSARFGALAQVDDAAAIDRLYAAGAWRVTDGGWIAALCGVDRT